MILRKKNAAATRFQRDRRKAGCVDALRCVAALAGTSIDHFGRLVVWMIGTGANISATFFCARSRPGSMASLPHSIISGTENRDLPFIFLAAPCAAFGAHRWSSATHRGGTSAERFEHRPAVVVPEE